MAHRPRDQLSSVPESPPSDDEDNSSDPNTFAATLGSFFNLNRRRRNLPRPSRLSFEPYASGSRPSQASNLRPDAAEFVPGSSTRMPTKRKASSSARPGKSAASSPRGNPANADVPIIRAEDLFGKDALVPKDGMTLDSSLDDDEHSDAYTEMSMYELRSLVHNNAQAAAQRRDAIREAVNAARSRPAERSKRPPDAPLMHSAMLFSYDNTGNSNRLSYLPLGPATPAGRTAYIKQDASLSILPSYRNRIDKAAVKYTPAKTNWPLNELPKEMFDLITDFLSRDDVKSMRLVCREFETKVSDTLFNTSVVPFNTELYDMIDEDAKASTRTSRVILRSRGKGKGRARDAPEVGLDRTHAGLQWQNDKDDVEGKVYHGHGLRVFRGFGPHIKRFGMSFEVSEGQLARPPIKRELDQVESYHGAYDWPPQQYTRFANLAGLERTADETLRMKAAFANLIKVQELGLSVESGLGWLNGPDKSVRAHIFERPSPVFGQSHTYPPEDLQQARGFWAALQASIRSMDSNLSIKEMALGKKPLAKTIAELPGIQGTRFDDPSLWRSITASNINAAISNSGSADELRQGVLHTTLGQPDITASFDKSALVPSELRKEQKEWLLETEWAQRAFLECYMLAIIDNPLVVANVRTLNIAKLSSSFLPILGRQSFWDALPSLTDVTIHVKPDWRTVEKDNAGFAETRPQNPSEAVRLFHRCILRDRICLRPSITKLNIGWVGGGEHAEGIFARNNNILPAPITQPEHSTAPAAGFGLVFKFVEELTLHNCWITPPALEELVKNHSDKNLRKLTLDSVSLTTHPRFPAAGQGGQNAHVAAAWQAAAQGQAPQGLQPFFNQGPAPGQANVQQNTAIGLPPNAPQMQNGPFPWHAAIHHVPNAPQAGQFQQQMMNQFFNMNNNQNHPVPPPPPNPFVGGPNPPNNNLQMHFPPPLQPNNNNVQPNPDAHWTEDLREGSWPELLNKISPGPVFTDYRPQPAPWEEQNPPRPETALQTIDLVSCGYVRLTNNNAFDQFAIQATDDQALPVWFRSRQSALAPAMMTTSDRYIARIVQCIPHREIVAVLLAWGIREGWSDGAKAEKPEFDGLLLGGTGRLTGTVEKGMPIVSARERAGLS